MRHLLPVLLLVLWSTVSPSVRSEPVADSDLGWRIVRCDSQEMVAKDQAARNAIDGDPNTIWHTEWKANSPRHPHEIVIDFGRREHVEAITYLPRQMDGDHGNIKDYEVYLGVDLDSLKLVAAGTFQTGTERKVISVAPVEARYLRLVALSEVREHPWASAAEIGILHTRLADVIQEFTMKSLGGNPEIFSLGEEFWNQPWMPDLNRAGYRISLSPANRIDIMILGDGYMEKEKEIFLSEATDWYRRFLGLHPFQEARGAFRVRAIWTPGQPAGRPDSFYHVGVDETGVSSTVSTAMSTQIFRVLDSVELNRRTLGNHYSHSYIVMLVKPCAGFGCGISGRVLIIHSPDNSKAISAGFGDDSLHEFGHSFAGLSDEYIDSVNSIGKPQASVPQSLLNRDNFAVSGNLSSTPERQYLRWKHISPGSEWNPDAQSRIGRLWRGGENEFGVWHSEPMCLMNGGHENWNAQMTSRHGWLRDGARLCFWCEELTAAFVWYLTGMLGDSTDGVALWSNWEKLRPDYFRAVQMKERIAEQSAVYRHSVFANSPLSADPAAPAALDSDLAFAFRIIHSGSGRTLAVSAGRVINYDPPLSGDTWALEGNGNGFVRFKNNSRGCYLQMQDGTTSVTCAELGSGEWSSHFILTNVGNGRYSIWNRWTNRILTIGSDGQPAAGAEDVRNPAKGVWMFEKGHGQTR